MIKHIVLFCSLFFAPLSACPTCLGRTMKQSTAPFFSDEHYTKYPAPDQEASAQEYNSDDTASDNASAETRP